MESNIPSLTAAEAEVSELAEAITCLDLGRMLYEQAGSIETRRYVSTFARLEELLAELGEDSFRRGLAAGVEKARGQVGPGEWGIYRRGDWDRARRYTAALHGGGPMPDLPEEVPDGDDPVAELLRRVRTPPPDPPEWLAELALRSAAGGLTYDDFLRDLERVMPDLLPPAGGGEPVAIDEQPTQTPADWGP
jgi:hypothetical protein